MNEQTEKYITDIRKHVVEMHNEIILMRYAIDKMEKQLASIVEKQQFEQMASNRRIEKL